MEYHYFIKGMVIGFSIAAPVGPMGILTIQRSLSHGVGAGLATGLGAATADAFYGCVAGFGLAFISGLLFKYQTWILFIGGLFLCGLGLSTLKRPASEKKQEPIFKGYLFSYFSALFLTLTNPMTIMAFMAIFAGLGLGASGKDYPSALTLVIGVFTGSCVWWLILASGVGLLGQKLTTRFQKFINKASGTVLMLFGIWALISLMPENW
ncbi:MAG: lysine transporter LysE [Desulfobacteraceae bacterium 4572_89]|nr:MAG: lysine transporter LysE [Desulfobacteraceae bacterium 4572_89]